MRDQAHLANDCGRLPSADLPVLGDQSPDARDLGIAEPLRHVPALDQCGLALEVDRGDYGVHAVTEPLFDPP